MLPIVRIETLIRLFYVLVVVIFIVDVTINDHTLMVNVVLPPIVQFLDSCGLVLNLVADLWNLFIGVPSTYTIFSVSVVCFDLLVNSVVFGPLILLAWTCVLALLRINRFQFFQLLFFPYFLYILSFCLLFYLQCTQSVLNYLLNMPFFYQFASAPQVVELAPNAFPQFYLITYLQQQLIDRQLSVLAPFYWSSTFDLNRRLYAFSSISILDYLMCSPDLLGLLFVGLTILIISLCLLFLRSVLIVETSLKLYVSLLLSILFLLNLVFLTPNLVVFFIAFESLLLPIIFLISLWGSPNKRQALNYLIFYTSIGAIPIIVAILYLRQKVSLFYNVNVLALSSLTFSWDEQYWLFLAFFFSFAIKTPIVPVHIWLPKAHVDAPTTGSVILAGLLLKIGLFGFIRFLFPIFPSATLFFSPYIAVFASIGVLYASLITLWQIDIKRIIAYSSVAHINMALVSLCSLSKFGCIAAVFMILSHGLISSALFFLVGFLYNRFHQRTVFYYGGLATAMPIFTIFFFFFSLANIAFPLTSGFISEFLCLVSIINLSYFLGCLNAVSMLITTGYSILLFGRLCLDNPKPWLFDLIKHIMRQKFTKINGRPLSLDLQEFEILIVLILSLFVIFFGIIPVDLLLMIENNINLDIFFRLLRLTIINSKQLVLDYNVLN